MAFNSLSFIFIFAPIVLILYNLSFLIKKKNISKIIIIISSLIFLFLFGWQHVLFIIGSLIINYVFAKLIEKQNLEKKRKLYLSISIVLNILFLFVTKYLSFFYESLINLFQGNGDVFSVFVPLGISYITFQQIAYCTDIYKNEYISHSFLDYCVFILFFPKIVCGPILFQKDFMPQLNAEDTYKVNYDNLFRGLYTFIIGLAKKVIIADSFAVLVNNGFANISALSSFESIVIMLSYTMQIYFDFSGYCDMACGISQMFNLKIINNFENPYQSYSVLEFWKSWHISLTKFLREYIYFPLGGSKKGQFRTILNIMAIFIISGLWHGANWTFILWGLVHGIFNVICRCYNKWWEKFHAALRWILNFVFINITWVIFRANSIQDVLKFFKRILTFDFTYTFGANYILLLVVSLILVLSFKSITNKEFKINWQRIVIGAILLICCVLLFSSSSITFLYSNF